MITTAIKGIFASVLLLSATTVSNSMLPQNDYIAFQQGEYLRYSMEYNGINGGEAVFEIKKDGRMLGGEKHFHVYVTGKTNRVVDQIYKVRDIYESFISEKTLLPSAFFRDVKEGDYSKSEYYLFNQNRGIVQAGETKHQVTANQTFDLVSAFYYLRCIDFSNEKTGYTVKVNAFFDGEVFPMGVKYEGKKTIKTDFGNVRCKVFTPLLITGRIFKDQSDMKLYVSDDKNQIPIRIESEVYMGTISATIQEYKGLKFPFSALEVKG